MGSGTPSLANTIGALFVGWGVSCLLLGIICTQAWRYYGRYPNDGAGNKLLVAFLWLCELFHQALVGHVVWFYAIANFGDTDAFNERPVWSLSIQVVLGATIATVVQICYAMRLWKFSNGSILAAAPLIAMVLVHLGLALVYVIKSFTIEVSQESTISYLGTISLALRAAVDIVTTTAMAFFLHRMRTGSPTDTLINRLTFFSLNTGFITCACSIAVLVCNRAMRNNFIYIGLYFVASKLYVIASIGTLNTRRFAPRGTTRTASTHHSTSTSSVLIPTLPAKPFAHAAPGASELSFNTLAGPEPETKVVYGIAR